MTEPVETGASLYAQAGVDTLAKAGGLADIGDRVRATFSNRSGLGRPLLPLGYFANVIDLADGRGLAISTDNVGTKVLVAQLMGRYDTVGIDCVAINVNDLLCVGAEPLSLVDYIAAERADQDQLAQIAAGLCEGARQARISISGGETAQVAELVRGAREGYGFDLSGTCVGVVDLDRLVLGRQLAPGDAVIGMASSGIHSNGLTLARRLFFDKLGYSVTTHLPSLGRRIGEELLEPTRIYVPAALEMLEPAGRKVNGAHHRRRADEPVAGGLRAGVRDRRSAGPAADIRADSSGRRGTTTRDVRGVQHGHRVLRSRAGRNRRRRRSRSAGATTRRPGGSVMPPTSSAIRYGSHNLD